MDNLDTPAANTDSSEIKRHLDLPQAIPNSPNDDERQERLTMQAMLKNADDDAPTEGTEPCLEMLQAVNDNGPPIPARLSYQEIEDGTKSKSSTGIETLAIPCDDGLPVPSITFAAVSTSPKLVRDINFEKPDSPPVQPSDPPLMLLLRAEENVRNQDEAFLKQGVEISYGLHSPPINQRTPNLPTQVTHVSNGRVQDGEEKEDVISIPEAFLVHDNAPEDAALAENYVVGTLMELDSQRPWHKQRRTKVMLAVVFCVVVVFSIVLGTLTRSSSNALSLILMASPSSAPSMIPSASLAPSMSEHPSLFPSLSPSVSKHPSSLPTVSSPPTSHKEALFEVDCDDFCNPTVAISGNTAVATRDNIDIQFFSFASEIRSSIPYEVVHTIDIDYQVTSTAIDGNTLVIGCMTENDGIGLAFVYEADDNGCWYLKDVLKPRDFIQGDSGEEFYVTDGTAFGRSVAVDGDVIVVGADDDGEVGEGSAYIFRRNQTSWTEETKLTAPRLGEGYGYSVSIKGNIVIVGDLAHGLDQSGSVFIYEYDLSTNSWIDLGSLTNDGCSSFFGSFVKLTHDEGLFVVCHTDNSTYYYEKQGESSMANEYILKQNIAFDYSLRSIDVDGDNMVVSEYRESMSNLIHFFVRRNHTWVHFNTIDERNVDSSLGYRVALSGNITLITSDKNVFLL